MPWQEPAARDEGLLVPQHPPRRRWEQGWRCVMGLAQEASAPPPAPPPPRAERQQCQQWLQPKPGPLEVAGEQGRCWFYGLSRDVFMAGMGLPWMLPSPALGDMAGACSASWC